MAYSKHIVHLYAYFGGEDLRNHLEVCVANIGICFVQSVLISYLLVCQGIQSYKMLHDEFFLVVIQIDAHIGSVNDIAFSHPKQQMSVITCGEDKIIKVWILYYHCDIARIFF